MLNFQNHCYGWIKTIQKLYYEERYFGVDFGKIDAIKIAKGFFIKSRRIEKNSEIAAVLKWALEQDEPVFLDILIDPPTEVVPPVVKWEIDNLKNPSERKKLTY